MNMIKQAADGHGGIFEAMRKNGILYDMQEKGIEWIFIGGVDNVLVKMVDPVLTGLMVSENTLSGGKSVVKACPEERVGVFCKKDGKPSVIEYTEISKELSEALDENGELLYGESHILCNLFNIDAIERMGNKPLPYHTAFKKATYIDKDGNKVDKTTSSVQITNSTSVMMTTVAENKAAIGYISLGSLNDTVKAVKIDGAEASAENVANDTYKVSRPFNIITTDKLSDAAQDFENYIMSADGQKIIQDNGYIKADEKAPAYKSNGAKGKVVVGGSSSVTPVMEKLKEAYAKANKDVTVEVQQSDSTTGVTNAIEGTCDIGMASRDLADSEAKKGAKATVIAKDGIAVIVNKDSKVDELTSAQVKDIYTGKTTKWADIK